MQTKLWAGRQDFRVPVAARDFSLLQNLQTGPGAHPALIQWDRGSLPRLKRSGCEVPHSLLSTVLPTTGVNNLASVALCRHRDSKFHE